MSFASKGVAYSAACFVLVVRSGLDQIWGHCHPARTGVVVIVVLAKHRGRGHPLAWAVTYEDNPMVGVPLELHYKSSHPSS